MKHHCFVIALLCVGLIGLPADVSGTTNELDDQNPVTEIRHYQQEFRYNYHLKLLDLVLSVTEDEFGPYRLTPVPEGGPEVAEARGVRMLANDEIDLVFLSTSREREDMFLPVRVPLLKGLLGFRLLLINPLDQPRFSDVTTLSDLTEDFRLGFNPHWVDYRIYENAGFDMVSSVSYDELFAMLDAGRFDIFPRGVNEVWQELIFFRSAHPNIDVERELLLYYPFPVFFFVRPENDQLRERLYRGLELIQEDGRFQKLLMRHYQPFVEKARLPQRRLIELENPTLPKDINVPDRDWWLKTVPKLPDN